MPQEFMGSKLGMYGHPRTDFPLFCTLTRVKVRTWFDVLRAWYMFKTVRNRSQRIIGLQRTKFLACADRSFIILSIWEREQALLEFASSVTSHHDSIRKILRRANWTHGSPEVWSTEWRIWSVSNNLNWDGPEEWAKVLDSANSVEDFTYTSGNKLGEQ